MMGHREKFKNGDEWDYLTRAKRYYPCRPGLRQAIKRKFWKRQRAHARSADLTGEE